MRAAVLLIVLALGARAAAALETAAWPPPAPVQERMHALQQAIIDPAASAAQREAAREELAGLLKSPAGQARGRTPDEKPQRPARAAIIPFPSVVQPLPPEKPAFVPPSAIAHVEVVQPPKPIVLPGRGTAAIPTSNVAIDPLNGHVLQAVPGGYVDPRTGQFVSH
jgi:hypothetical protein